MLGIFLGNGWVQSCSIPSVYRAGYIKQLIGQVAVTSFNRRRHRFVHIGAYLLNNLNLGYDLVLGICFGLGIGCG